jgi:hypothetical protein
MDRLARALHGYLCITLVGDVADKTPMIADEAAHENAIKTPQSLVT